MRYPFAFFVMMLFLPATLLAEIRFEVTPERTVISLDEQIVVTAAVVSTTPLTDLLQPPLPASEYFSVVRTSRNQNQSQSVQLVNGRMTRSVQITYLFHYVLAPKKTGTFTFPALTLTHDGATYTSNPFSMTINAEAVANPDISVRLYADKRKLFVGEQAILTFEVAHKPQAALDLPEQGWMEAVRRIEENVGRNFSVARLFGNRLEREQTRIGGELYLAYRLRFSVIPITEGTVAVEPIPYQYHELRQEARRRSDPFFDGFFGDFFGGGVKAIPRTTHTAKLVFTCRPLPPPPSDFMGAVGTGSLHGEVSRRELAAGEAITLKIDLKGNTRPGNLGGVTLPKLDAFEVFTPEENTYIDTSNQGITTRKTYKYLLIPRKEGEVTIPPVAWSYFDPSSESYRQLTAGPFQLTVAAGAHDSRSQGRYLTREEIRQIGSDIRYIKTPPRITDQASAPHRNLLFLILFPAPFFAALFATLYKLQMTQRNANREQSMRNRTARRAMRELAGIGSGDQKLPGDVLAARLAATLNTYISNRFGIAAAGATLDELTRSLAGLGLPPDFSETFRSFHEHLDACRFAGGAVRTDSAETLASQARRIVEQLEQASKGRKKG